MTFPENNVINIMQTCGIDLVTTLPCDRIKNLLALISITFPEIRLTREENGIGICAGAYMAGAKPMMVIQSTGLGNMINAIESLNIACRIPLPILASWRGVYKEKIEAQVPLGVHLPDILKGAGIKNTIIDDPKKLSLLGEVISDAYDNLNPHVALVSPRVWKNSNCCVWKERGLPLIRKPSFDCKLTGNTLKPEMIRFDAISAIAQELENEIAVVNLGIPCKEMYAARDRNLTYYMLGSMGLASSIGLGLSLRSKKKVVVLDGDGSILMNPNALMEIGSLKPSNLIIIILDNASYGSTGSQETCTARMIDLEILARCCGFPNTVKAHTKNELVAALKISQGLNELSLIHVILKPGNMSFPNISLTPTEITERFRNELTVSNLL